MNKIATRNYVNNIVGENYFINQLNKCPNAKILKEIDTIYITQIYDDNQLVKENDILLTPNPINHSFVWGEFELMGTVNPSGVTQQNTQYIQLNIHQNFLYKPDDNITTNITIKIRYKISASSTLFDDDFFYYDLNYIKSSSINNNTLNVNKIISLNENYVISSIEFYNTPTVIQKNNSIYDYNVNYGDLIATNFNSLYISKFNISLKNYSNNTNTQIEEIETTASFTFNTPTGSTLENATVIFIDENFNNGTSISLSNNNNQVFYKFYIRNNYSETGTLLKYAKFKLIVNVMNYNKHYYVCIPMQENTGIELTNIISNT